MRSQDVVLWVFTALFLFLTAVVGAVPSIVGWAEVRYVINPQPPPANEKPLDGRYFPLKSGGHLFHYRHEQAENDGHRKLFLIPGSSHPLDSWNQFLVQAHERHYDVWAVEYAGFGQGYQVPEHLRQCALGDLLLHNIHEAWSVIADEETVVVGFSLGGLSLGAVYDDLQPAPAQLVFASTCGSIEGLLREKLWLPADGVNWLMMPFLHTTRWKTLPPRKYRGKVLIVHAKDDRLIGIHHARQLYDTFAALQPCFVELPDGGHVTAFVRYWDDYFTPDFILPP